MSTLFWLTAVAFVLAALLLTATVLIQRGGAARSIFGTGGDGVLGPGRTPTVLTWATAAVFGAFLVLAIALNLLA